MTVFRRFFFRTASGEKIFRIIKMEELDDTFRVIPSVNAIYVFQIICTSKIVVTLIEPNDHYYWDFKARKTVKVKQFNPYIIPVSCEFGSEGSAFCKINMFRPAQFGLLMIFTIFGPERFGFKVIIKLTACAVSVFEWV